MALEFKKNAENKVVSVNQVDLQTHQIGLPFAPIGTPVGIPQMFGTSIVRKTVEPPPLALPGSDLPRALNYLADYSGCGWWRCGAPEMLLNYNQKMIINSLTTMVTDPRFYMSGWKAVKLQRQATPLQKEFVNFVKHLAGNLGAKIIYEVDDIVFHEDIPMFNRCRGPFTDPEIRRTIEEIIDLCDEFVVVSEYMKDYYKSKIRNQKITCIPNYAPRMWFDRFYNPQSLADNFEKNKKRPVVLITGSGTHYDVANANNQKDDYSHITQHLIRTRKDFHWVFMGGFPVLLKPFIDSGEMSLVDWTPLMHFPEGIMKVSPQVTVAALADNHFNRAKSFIKLTESGYLGIPFVGQDLEPYKNAFNKFITGDDMIDQLKVITKDADAYMASSKQHRTYSDGFWLDDDKNLLKHKELYVTPYNCPTRQYLLEHNPEQKPLIITNPN